MAYEDQPRHFYVTLLSNASQTLYPANTLSSFKTHLARPADLVSDGIWEVGVCEVTFRPYNVGRFSKIQVVSAENALIYYDLIAPQLVGNYYVRVLRSFIKTTYCNRIFDSVYYMPAEKRQFQDIEIRIMRLDGKPATLAASDVPTKIVLH
jgi:CRISPR/Cas system-associated endoribonuclease Cas2